MSSWNRTKTTAIAVAPLLLYGYLPGERTRASA
jgi:hypothetical protein